MADFCRQCSHDMFGQDTGDLANISKVEDTNKGLYALVICEGCGLIQVDHTGSCVSEDCYANHGKS